MKYRVTAAIAVVLAATQAGATGAAQGYAAADPPVQETQAPENEATNPEQRVAGPLPPAAARAPATQPAKPEKWNVNAPPGMTTRQVRIDVDEGTWMNVDVSRDGRTIAFDLLGDIYTMPIARRHADADRRRPRLRACSRASRPTAGGSPSPRTGAAATISGS